ncbi:MAG: phosphate ABC transporter permease PstA [Bacteroidetes bacterium]|nr:phosphate ABC transporter permease PstA [Bacteroidota bacterium]
MDKLTRFRFIKDKLFKSGVVLLTLLSTVPLLLIIFYIAKQGVSSINWEFFINLPKPVGEKGGGILNALIGSIIIIIVASIIAIPFGTMVGLYLSEYRKDKLAYWVGLCVDVLQGIPSIVLGIIIYLWVVKPTGHFSAISGSIALAIMMLPPIIKSTEETLKLIPDAIKEASLSLGVPYYKTILRIMLPASLSGILTGSLLSISRVAGETAPLLFTAFGNPFINSNILKPMSSLPLLIFNYASSPYEEWHQLAWGASFVLIMMILILNIFTKILERKWKIQF